MPLFPSFRPNADANPIFGLCVDRYAGWYDFSERLMRGTSRPPRAVVEPDKFMAQGRHKAKEDYRRASNVIANEG